MSMSMPNVAAGNGPPSNEAQALANMLQEQLEVNILDWMLQQNTYCR